MSEGLVCFHWALVDIQATELPRRSTTRPVTQKNMVSWGIWSMLTASSCTHFHHLSLTSAFTKPLGAGFKDTKRTFWLIPSWGEKAALLFSEPTRNPDQQKPKQDSVQSDAGVGGMVQKNKSIKCRHLLRVVLLSTCSMGRRLSEVRRHTDMAERKVNRITEQGLDRQTGSICKQSQMSQTDKHSEMTFLG